MARGRAVDSDTSGSGLCGGHGRGRSTHGRGGTIPLPSSSGTSGPSSFTQLHVMPSLPSIPSSSTPLLGPTESSLASQSPTALASSRPQPDHSAEEISALWAHVDEQERRLTELKAHVMRMSGHHGAATSSFDPLSAIDPHFSIALH
ncbi:hypothetical protein JCGZ_00337 [Jatropha curcas]|uniref:Uncharacterized protein n=1 Tax=Jatropha curcas TaxID=180498 RepID=A0A067JK36_JATCU|nr:hypothetical protein JCGZ_00337 [Jatropha curcas]